MKWLWIVLFTSLAANADDFPKLKWAGDLRLRTQFEKDGDNETRINERIRLRFGVSADVTPEIRTEFRVATAKANRSTNQVLGDSAEPAMTRRFVGLDLGYLEWKPAEFVKVVGGRFAQLQYRPGDSQMLLDEDISLEGGAVRAEYGIAENWTAFALLGSAYVRENYDDDFSIDLTDIMLNFGQAGLTWKSDRTQVTFGGGFYNFTRIEGALFSDLVPGGKAQGNSEGAVAGTYAAPFLPKQFFVDTRFPLGDVDIGPFAEIVQNSEAAIQNKAYFFGLYLGQKSWDARVAYSEVQADSVVGLFTDSDFAGGNTDSRGWIVSGRWKFAKGMNVKLTQFVNRTRVSSIAKEYNRTHIDVSASF